jgi:hypothetical protein
VVNIEIAQKDIVSSFPRGWQTFKETSNYLLSFRTLQSVPEAPGKG